MCGIFCSIQRDTKEKSVCNVSDSMEKEVKQLLKQRGPDKSSLLCVDQFSLLFGGFVLWHQGNQICSQPFDRNEAIFLFNGDIFNVDHQKPYDMSDTTWLATCLSNCQTDNEICSLLRTLEGPFSFIFFNKLTQDLYFARDSLGRNSLIIEQNESFLRILSVSYFSDSHKTKIMELPPLGLFKLNVSSPSEFTVFPWSSSIDDEWKTQMANVENIFEITISIRDSINPSWLQINQIKETQIFDFYNICNRNTSTESLYEQLLTNLEVSKSLDKFSLLLENSVRNRVQKTANYCRNCIKHREECNHSKCAILFSGGIDCSILAVLADKYVDKSESIDLINVAFEMTNTNVNKWNVPDRCTAKDSFAELQKLCPYRKWNFIEVNISREELHSALDNHIKHLIYPLEKILDESIGCAFWFAAHGNGILNGESFKSSARVIIVGSGADELFGGYIRHRNAYLRCSGNEMEKQTNVHKELEKDWQRIPSRNLARDDRVIGDSGKTSRAPFIEEHVVQYVRSLKPNQRSCFLLGEGIGDKLFLRVYGYRLGLKSSATLRKRAIQFGSRIANKKQNAADQSVYLKFN